MRYPARPSFPDKRPHIIKVQSECETCHAVLQQFRNNVAFNSRAEVARSNQSTQCVTREDTSLDLESGRKEFLRLMAELISKRRKRFQNCRRL
jgi:hypothetical protein